ncbi:MAG TPA: ABC transporter substrate-binding protein [Myxococcales bacterium]
MQNRAVVLSAALAALLPLAAAPADKPIKIAIVDTMTGGPALYGIAGIEGAKLAVADLNAGKGVLGRKVELIVRDDNAKPDVGARETRDVILREEVAAIFGPVSSGVLLAMSEVAKENKTILISHTANTERAFVERGHRYIFSVVPNTFIEGSAMGQYMAQKPYKRYAIIGPGYEFGYIQADAFERRLKENKKDVEIVAKVWPKLGETDYTSYITSIIAANPDAVYSNLFGSDLIAFTKQAKGYDFFKKFPFAALYDVDTLQGLGKDAVEGVIGYERGPFHVIRKLAPSDRLEKFMKAYQAKTGKYPSTWAINAYDGVMTWAKAVQKAGTADTEKVVDALEGLELDSLRGPGRFIRKVDHQANVGSYIGTVAWEKGFTDFATYKDPKYVAGDLVWRPEGEVPEVRAKAAGK